MSWHLKEPVLSPGSLEGSKIPGALNNNKINPNNLTQIMCGHMQNKYANYILSCTKKGFKMAHKKNPQNDTTKPSGCHQRKEENQRSGAELPEGAWMWCPMPSWMPWQIPKRETGSVRQGLRKAPGLRLPSVSTLQVDTRGERLIACPSAPSHHSRLQKLSSLTGWSEG